MKIAQILIKSTSFK